MDTVLKTQSNKSKKKKSLARRIFFNFMLFSVIMIVILWLLQIVFLESFYKQIKIQSLKFNANSAISSINSEDFQNIVSDMAKNNNISVKILDCSTFEELLSIKADDSTVIEHLRDSELFIIYESAVEGGGQYFQHYQLIPAKRNNAHLNPPEQSLPAVSQDIEYESFPEEEFKRGAPPFFRSGIAQELLYARIVHTSDERELLVLFSSVITPIVSTVKTLQVQLICVSVTILILAAILAKNISKRVSKPILNINNSAKRLAEGEYKTQFDSGEYLEISQLSDTLNYTANRLQVADTLKKELISNISHDLRTPLTMIIGYAEVMRDIPGESTPENIQVIIDEAKRLTTLVNDMLDLSKLQSDASALEMSTINITELTGEIVERLVKLTEKDGFSFSFENDGDVYVNADKTKIMQVLYNFLSNAVNYSEDSREIKIKQTAKHSKVRIEVTDKGSGIPKDELPHIWDRYYKIDKTHKRSSVGSGIGLSIVKSILELHGAKYGVISTVGVGSTFWFELDIAK